MHFQALLLQIVAVIIITYTSGLDQYKYKVNNINMEIKVVTLGGERDPHLQKRDQRPKALRLL